MNSRMTKEPLIIWRKKKGSQGTAASAGTAEAAVRRAELD
jgi:hypothetical protein